MTLKPREIGCQLVLPVFTNRTSLSRIGFRLVPKSANVNDLERHVIAFLCYSTEFGSLRQLRKSG